MEVAAQALAELRELSAEISTAVLFDGAGGVAASTLDDAERAAAVARAAERLLAAAQEARGNGSVTQLEASTREGSVFVVADGERRIVATAGRDAPAGLVFYDLRACLRKARSKADAAS